MAVRFVIGRAGSGKTQRCFDAIVEHLRRAPLGKPIFWLLPRQATFVAERRLTCESGLPGFVRARVLSFDQLIQHVLEESGGAAVPEVTPLGRHLIIGHLLRENRAKLRFFSQVARHASLAASLASMIDEIEHAGHDSDTLSGAVRALEKDGRSELPVDTSHLSDKLRDLHLIYSAYTAFLGQDRLDPRRRLQLALAAVAKSPSLRGASVYVDDFTEFTQDELRVLASIGKVAGEVEINFAMDPGSPVLAGGARGFAELPLFARAAGAETLGEMSLFHRLERLLDRVRKAMSEVGIEPQVERLRQSHRMGNDTLRILERHLFDARAPGHEADPTALRLVEAPDRRAEVEAAAAQIRSLLMEGFRLRDVAVLVRQLDGYDALISATFTEHGIAHFMDRRRTMAHHPLLQAVRAVAQLASGGWPHDAMMTLLKSGLSGLANDDVDGLENYVLEHQIRGDGWASPTPWQRMLRGRSEDQPDDETPDDAAVRRVDEARRSVVDALRPLVALIASAETRAVRELAGALFETIEKLGTPRVLAGWIEAARAESDHEAAAVHEQAWTEVVSLFQQMVELLGDKELPFDEFREVLEAGLESFDLAVAPPTVDQVLVGQADRTRAGPVRAMLLLGVHEGLFPHAAHDRSLLSDAERSELQRRGLETPPGGQRKLLDEALLAYSAMTRASERLYLSRPLSDDGGRLLPPSPFWRAVLRLFPRAEVRSVPRDRSQHPDLVVTPRHLLTSLMSWARRQAGAERSDNTPSSEAGPGGQLPWPGLYHWLSTYPPCGDALDNLRCRAWKALGYDNRAWLRADLATALYPKELQVRAWQLESFAACPFQHFARSVLRLTPRLEEIDDEPDISRAFHSILEQLVRNMLSRRRSWPQLDAAAAQALIDSYKAEVLHKLGLESSVESPRGHYIMERVRNALMEVVRAQRLAAERGAFVPVRAGIRFGGRAGVAPLRLPLGNGRELQLLGEIDRVDLLSSKTSALLLDYRVRAEHLDLGRAILGLSLRLVTQLLVLRSNAPQIVGPENAANMRPAGALSVRLHRSFGSVKHPEEAPPPESEDFALRVKPRGVFDAAILQDLDPEIQPGETSDVVAAHVKLDRGISAARSDAVSAEQLEALLDTIEAVIADIGRRILAGDISVSPYRIGRKSPCTSCDFRDVCRFDAELNGYRFLEVPDRSEALRRCVEGGKDAG